LLQFAGPPSTVLPAPIPRGRPLSREAGRPYVTIDCGPDSALHAGASATIVLERIHPPGRHPEPAPEELLRSYNREGPGPRDLHFWQRGHPVLPWARHDPAPEALSGGAPNPRSAPATFSAGAWSTESSEGWRTRRSFASRQRRRRAPACVFPWPTTRRSLEEITSLAATAAG